MSESNFTRRGKIPSDEKRVIIIYIIFLVLFAICAARLYILASGTEQVTSVLKGQYSRRIDFAQRRGYVLSRELVPMGVDEDKKYLNVIDPTAFPDKYAASERMAKFTKDVSPGHIRELFMKGLPFYVVSDKELKAAGIKSYPFYGDQSAEAIHVVGYVSQGVGANGLQKRFEAFLGKEGAAYGKLFANYDATATGTPLDGSNVRIVNDGFDECEGVITTLDKRLSEYAELVADAYIPSGAIVVMSKSGEILVMTSRPNYTPESIADFLTSDKGEFINRCLEGFAPGSVFKTVVAAAALRTDTAYFEKQYECTGSISFGNMTHRCHKYDGHGLLDMKEAFANSCNCYFIQLGVEIGMDRIFNTASKLGIAKGGNIYGLGSYGGFLPHKKHYPPSEIANCVIGQGEILVSPVEACVFMLACSCGKVGNPYIVNGFIADGHVNTRKNEDESENVLEEDVIILLKEILGECVRAGTGKSAAPTRLTAGGKTATAQTGRFEENKELNHIWFSGVYPLEDPEIAVTVLLDYTLGNTENAELAFRAICEEYACLAGK